ncbi:hypothetical protein EJB05_10215, partial [Eragrostis curvula]
MAPNASNIQPTDDADVLSLLPSDVLVSILEKLTLRDAIRAGALSRRWRQLSGQLPRLALDFVDFMPGPGKYHDEDDEEELDTPASSSDDALSAAGDRMLEVATAVLASRAAGQQQLPVCAMSFYLRHNYMSLGRLLDDAVAGGKVRAAELTVSTTCVYEMDDDDDQRSKTLRSMLGYGRRFRVLFDSCPAAFGSLTRLTIEQMTLGESDLDDVLTACTRLEFLSLETCYTERSGLWRVRHERLADLRISHGAFEALDLLWLPRLERFAYRYSGFQNLSFGHVPHLTTLTISSYHVAEGPTVKLSQILANTAVKDLRLNLGGKDIWVEPEAPKALTNVFRHLKYLKLRLWDHECNMQRDESKNCFPTVEKCVPLDAATDFQHSSLTLITIQGLYSTEDILVRYICRLMRAAINLEEIRMRKNAACEDCDSAKKGFPQTDKEIECLIKRVTDGGSIPLKNIVES